MKSRSRLVVRDDNNMGTDEANIKQIPGQARPACRQTGMTEMGLE